MTPRDAREGTLPEPSLVVLSTRTMFAEGIVAHLRQNLAAHELRTLDASLPDVMEQLTVRPPGIIILDAADEGVNDRCLLNSLVSDLPGLTIIRLDPHQGRLQLVTSQRRAITQISDLVSVINSLTRPVRMSDGSPTRSLETKEDTV
jgi:hypothetical protein